MQKKAETGHICMKKHGKRILVLLILCVTLAGSCLGCGEDTVSPPQIAVRSTEDPAWAAEYQKIRQYMDDGNFAEAIALLEELENRGCDDAADMLKEVKYNWALALAENGDHIGAYEKLKDITDYADAQQQLEQQRDAIYAEGKTLYAEGNYYEAEKRFLRISSTHPDAPKYMTLINARNYVPSESLVEELKSIFFFADANRVLMYNYGLACIYLRGTWQSLDGHFFIMSDEGNCVYSLPYEPHGNKFYIQEGTLSLYDRSNARDLKATFEITPLMPNCISVYCHQDGRTYLLFRDTTEPETVEV